MVKEAKIQFQNFVVSESHIVFREPGQYKISVNFNPEGFILPNLNQFHLKLQILVKDEENKFDIDLKSISIFTYDPEADIEDLKTHFFVTNAPAITFPYLRSYISALTSLSGMPTLTLPTLNLTGLTDVLRDNITVIED